MKSGWWDDAEYFVMNERQLCYRYPHMTRDWACLLAELPDGGGYKPFWGSVIVTPRDACRKATIADFKRFRVCYKGRGIKED